MVKETDYIYNIPKFSKKSSLANTRIMLDRIGFDENSKKIIHVAGTNGKGSVCAYLAGILGKAGKKTGLFTSPHLVRVNERIVINGEEVTDSVFEDSFKRIKKISEDMVRDGFDHPSFFEFLFGMAMDIFKNSDTEYIILETGLGGRLDATNVITRPVMTVLTSISLDHTEILGDTYEKIAMEKAGIIKEGVPVLFINRRKDVTDVFMEKAREKNAPVTIIEPDDIKDIVIKDKNIDFCLHNKYYDNEIFSVQTKAEYQAENASLAATAAAMLSIDRTSVKEGLSSVVWIGRMQRMDDGLVVDGGHNDDGIEHFLASVRKDGWKGRRILLFSAVKDKHYAGMIDKICTSGLFRVIVTGVLDDKRGIDTATFKKVFDKYDCVDVIHCANVPDAYRKLMELSDENTMKYAVGSLYLAGEILNIEWR